VSLVITPDNAAATPAAMPSAGALSAPMLLGVVLAYFALLLGVAWWTSRRSDNASFFVGNKSSHWLLVDFGMIGASLSGVTFISVPGMVAGNQFAYLQIIAGQLIGYALVAFVLLPLYYRFNVSSIYTLLALRLGASAHRTGASFFILSRTLGATARLYLVVRVLQDMVLERMGLPFWLSAAVVLLMILLYTMEGGVKTIVWTDTLQTAGMLGGLLICVGLLLHALGLDLWQGWQALDAAGMTRVIVQDPASASFWGKQLLAGAAIAVAMTGLDQEMMQKSLSVAKLRDAQKNLLVLGVLLLVVIGAFLLLGGLLSLYAQQHGIDARGDALFPTVVMQHLPAWVQVVFVLALVSALLPSADGALTALTASTCLDLLRIGKEDTRTRQRVHLGFAVLFLALVLGFKALDNASMIYLILKLAGYTYRPLLGLFAFAMFTPKALPGRTLVAVCLVAPALCAVLDFGQPWGGYQIGLELLLLNGVLTWGGLWLVARRNR